MGKVYLAQDTKLDRKVALKILPADLAGDWPDSRKLVASNLACSQEQHPFAAAEDPGHTPGHQRRQRSCQQGS